MGHLKSNKVLRNIWTVSLIFATFGLYAQVTNEGELFVSSETMLSVLNDFNNTDGALLNNDGEVYFYADYHNDGAVDFLEDTGITVFGGTEVQHITGAQPNYFYHVLFDNPTEQSAFKVYSDISISGDARFLRGIIDHEPYGGKIDFEVHASHFDTSNGSHVNGAVNKVGDEDFVFPIGDGGFYRLAGIASDSPDAYFTGIYFSGNSDEIHSHELKPDGVYFINKEEYWTVENHSGTSENIFITLSYDESTTPQSFINAAQQGLLTIVRWDQETNMWIDEGGQVNLEEKTVTTATRKLGMFTLASMDKDLMAPCHIVVYNAVTPNGDGINDFFRIDNQGDCAKKLTVKVFDRWGIEVFKSQDYGKNGDVFDGFSSGRLTLGKNSDRLPTGTYFYTLEYDYESPQGLKRHRQAGYLYLSGN